MKIEIIPNKLLSQIWIEDRKIKEVETKLYKCYFKKILHASSEETLNDLLLNLDIKTARTIIYRLLMFKGYMKSELVQKLQKRKIGFRAIEVVLQECEKLGYINDEKEGIFLVQRKKRKGFGPRLLAYELETKAPDLVQLASVPEEEQIEMIQKWIDKKACHADLSEIKVKQKIYRFLRGKGFDYHLIYPLLFI